MEKEGNECILCESGTGLYTPMETVRHVVILTQLLKANVHLAFPCLIITQRDTHVRTVTAIEKGFCLGSEQTKKKNQSSKWEILTSSGPRLSSAANPDVVKPQGSAQPFLSPRLCRYKRWKNDNGFRFRNIFHQSL